MTQALFVLSTGRCGTQWLAEVLAAALGDRATVVHEPLGNDYAARAMLGARVPEKLDPERRDAILDHVAMIEETLATREYVECGHPLWSSLPYLLGRFAGRVRVVHLVRHPVPTALSWLTHAAYTEPFAEHLPEKVLLSAFDDGVCLTSYRESWPSLTPYEKALFYWAEVNGFGIRLAARTDVPWLRARFEDLTSGVSLRPLLDFAGAGGCPVLPRGTVDRFRYLTDAWADPHLIERHPAVIEIAESLGYDPLEFDTAKLHRRYVEV
jgi:hypothetical protein